MQHQRFVVVNVGGAPDQFQRVLKGKALFTAVPDRKSEFRPPRAGTAVLRRSGKEKLSSPG